MLPARMAYNRWTKERLTRLVALVRGGCDVDAIVTELAPTTVQSIRNMCTRIGLPLRDPREASSACTLRLAPAQRAQLERLARQAWGQRQYACAVAS